MLLIRNHRLYDAIPAFYSYCVLADRQADTQEHDSDESECL